MMKKLLIAGLFLFPIFSSAGDFSVGDIVVCGLTEGRIESLYSRNSAIVHFFADYENGYASSLDDSVLVADINDCHKKLSTSRNEDGVALGDTVLCSGFEGKVLSFYERAISKVAFYASYDLGHRREVDSITFVQLKDCQTQRKY